MKNSAEIQAITDIFRSSITRKEDRQVGIEVERIAFTCLNRSLTYDAPEGKPSAHKLLLTLHEKHGWPLVNSSVGKPIGLTAPTGKVSLEPGSQLEFSSEPYKTIFDVQRVLADFEEAVDDITCDWGLGWSSIGLNPIESPEDKILIPSPRYGIMSEYLPTRGKLALAMMRLTTSVQINLDYTSEAEGIEMLRVALLAAPVSYALFANSPLYLGKPTDFLSYRGAIWQDTDPDRSGMLPEVFDADFGFESYAKRLYSTPLMFVEGKDGGYVPAKGRSFADIAEGRWSEVECAPNRMSTVRQLFTEARLKPGYIEVRSVDGQSAAYRYAATAFWTGLLYDEAARDIVAKRLLRAAPEKRQHWLLAVLKDGLRATVDGIPTQALAEEFVGAAEAGLVRRGFGEEKLLEPLKKNLTQGLCPADHVLRLFQESCREDLSCLIRSSTRCRS